MIRNRLCILSILLACTWALTAACRSPSHKEQTPAPESEHTFSIQERLGDWPFLVPIPQLAPMQGEDGEIGVKAKDCAECHDEVYADWKRSTHATALQDLQYLAELAKPDSPVWLCLNCHIPIQNQREQLIRPATLFATPGRDIRKLKREPNPAFDPAMQQESITCATCHVRPLASGQSQVIAPHKTGDAPHPVKEDRKHLRAMCLRCHSPGRARITPTFFCWFETAEELAAGPFAGKRDCVDCHMPRQAANEADPGKSRHHWVGGGVPKWFDAYDCLPKRGWKPGLEISRVGYFREENRPILQVSVEYSNAEAGHKLPTADPERFLLLAVELKDATGKSISRKSLRIGQHWDWGDEKTGREARRLTDNRLDPAEKRTWKVELPLPDKPKDAHLVVTALHGRLTVENARHMKTAPVEPFENFLPGVGKMLARMESHYPFFSWVYREEIDLDGSSRKWWSEWGYARESRKAAKMTLEEIGDLLQSE